RRPAASPGFTHGSFMDVGVLDPDLVGEARDRALVNLGFSRRYIPAFFDWYMMGRRDPCSTSHRATPAFASNGSGTLANIPDDCTISRSSAVLKRLLPSSVGRYLRCLSRNAMSLFHASAAGSGR